MRIIYVTASLPFGSDEAFVIPEIQQLAQAGHDVLIVPRSTRGCLVHDRSLCKAARCEALLSPRVLVTAMAVTARAPYAVAGAIRSLLASRSFAILLKNLVVVPKALWLAQVAQQWRADHIHCHWAATTASVGMLASALSRIPWSFTAHRWDIVENNLLASKAKKASFVRFISEDGLHLAHSAGVDADRNLQVMHMGVRVPSPYTRRQTRGTIVVCPARLVAVKGHRNLLRAWRILRRQGLVGELWLAGDGELRGELERLCVRLQIDDSVKFLGTLPHEELLALYKEVSISAVVLPSVDLGNGCHEGIPVALMEAMSYGIPVVATATGGTGELVEGAGLLVPPENAAALADALRGLLLNRNERIRLGYCGRERVLQHFNIVQITGELVRRFETSRLPSAAGQFA